MKYNIMHKEENLSLIQSLVDSYYGKLVITSLNSFVISNLLEELKEGADNGGYNLYNGNILLNPQVKSDIKIILVGLLNIKDIDKSIIDESFYVAEFNKDETDDFVFNVTAKSIKEFDILYSNPNIVNNTVDDSNDILQNLKSHNVIFIQDINDKVINDIKKEYTVLKYETADLLISDSYLLTPEGSYMDGIESEYDITNYTALVVDFDVPEDPIKVEDLKTSIVSYLDKGVKFIGGVNWVKLFLELSYSNYNINMSSVVIYNSSNFGLMGNDELFDKYRDQSVIE